ncbi:hypothetical protein [Streptomyces djakartensis]|uniref:hypothetical protein n=1 Tax=Streptomyces djakartensis TaxID=68193 RepID=UPI0034DF6A9B
MRGHPDTGAEEAVVTYHLLSAMQPVGPPPAPEGAGGDRQGPGRLPPGTARGGRLGLRRRAARSESATGLRPAGGEVLITDEPYAEGREMPGGSCLVRAPRLDAAPEWGRPPLPAP